MRNRPFDRNPSRAHTSLPCFLLRTNKKKKHHIEWTPLWWSEKFETVAGLMGPAAYLFIFFGTFSGRTTARNDQTVGPSTTRRKAYVQSGNHCNAEASQLTHFLNVDAHGSRLQRSAVTSGRVVSPLHVRFKGMIIISVLRPRT